jgi:hypothetical protein
MSADSPVFDLKIFDAHIFPQIIGDDRQSARLGLPCDQDIEGADRLTGFGKSGTDLACGICVRLFEGNDRKILGKQPDRFEIE